MARTVTAREASEQMADLLRQVGAGETVTITDDGQPVAQLTAIEGGLARREAARARLLEHFKTVKPIVVGPWTRDELYEREPWKE